MNNSLKGKIALITGATSGIGKACAITLAKEGMNLIIAARRQEILLDLKEQLERDYNIKVFSLLIDVKNPDDIVKKFNLLTEDWENISLLVNNAGLALGMEKLHKTPIWDVDKMVDTNIKGLVFVSHEIIPRMLRMNKPATIINIGSTAGDSAYPGGSIYCATKAAVKTLSDGMRIDLIDTPIKVTDLKPGMVETSFSTVRFKGHTEKSKAVYEGIVPLYAEDIAEVVKYIASLPDNVQIPEITVTPNHQADGRTVYRTEDLDK